MEGIAGIIAFLLRIPFLDLHKPRAIFLQLDALVPLFLHALNTLV